MPIYEVNVDVKKQIDSTACWASLTVAIAEALGYQTPDQSGLKNHFAASLNTTGLTAGQMKLDVALQQKFNIGSQVHKFSVVSTSDEMNRNVAAIGTAIADTLKDGVPVVCGLTTHDNQGLQLKSGGTVSWRHAVLIYKIDTDAQACWLKDPAKGDNISRSVTLPELVTGFIYMSPSQMGPTMAQRLTMTGPLTARVFQLIVPVDTIGLAGMGIA